jgi:uncharacterized protein
MTTGLNGWAPLQSKRGDRSGWIEVFHYGDNRQRLVSYALLEDGMRYEDYPAFPQPALIFHGLYDDVVPLEYSRQFAANQAMPV